MSLYLSRLILNPRSRQVTSELADAYQMHRTLMRAFPSQEAGGPGRVLFRVDTDMYSYPVILVQSDKEPDWGFLSERIYLADIQDSLTYKPYNPIFREGQRLRFLLRANPTVRKIFEDGKPGRRIGLCKEAEQTEWFKRKGECGGFHADSFSILPNGKQISRREGQSNTHVSVVFTGVLTVTDPELFRNTLESGIGSAKGFGFGLLSIAPIR